MGLPTLKAATLLPVGTMGGRAGVVSWYASPSLRTVFFQGVMVFTSRSLSVSKHVLVVVNGFVDSLRKVEN